MSRTSQHTSRRAAEAAPHVVDDHAEASPSVQLERAPGVGTTNLDALMAAGGNTGMVQLAGGDAAAGVHEAAASGVAGGGGALPHGEAIQRSFGGHDVGGVQAHVGGRAAEATQAMGAEAYATGNHIAFGSQPDLHTAAHEAAHVVQQRSGVQLAGGVGRSGDAHERHADAVADRVVAGQPAGDLLAQYGGGKERGGAVQRKAVQREDAKEPAKKESGPKITTAETTAFDFSLMIPLYGPIKLEGKVGGSFTTKGGSEGKKTEVEGMLYGGIVVDLWIVKLRAGIEGKVKFTVDGDKGILETVKKGINEIAQWKLAKDFQPKLESARSSLQFAFNAQVQGFSTHATQVLTEIRKGNKTAADTWYFSKSPREWAMWYAEGWNRSLSDRFEGLGAEIVQSRLLDVNELEKRFDKIKGAADTAAAEKLAMDAHSFGISELARTFTESKKALDQVQIVKNDPSVAFEASVAFKAGVSVQASATTSAEIEVAAVTSIEDKGGQSKWDTAAQSATVVSGKVAAGGFEAALVGNWKKDEVEISGEFKKQKSSAPEEVAKHSVGSVMSAVKGAGTGFQMLASPAATTRAVISQLGQVVADSAKDLVDPKKIAEAKAGSASVGQGIGIEVKLKFKRAGFKLAGGSVKITLTAAKIEAKKALGAAASVGVGGSLSKGVSFEAAWGE